LARFEEEEVEGFAREVEAVEGPARALGAVRGTVGETAGL